MHSGSIEFMRVQRLARQAFIQKYSTVKSLDAKLRMLIADVVIHSWPERFVSLCESVFARSAECPERRAQGDSEAAHRSSPAPKALVYGRKKNATATWNELYGSLFICLALCSKRITRPVTDRIRPRLVKTRECLAGRIKLHRPCIWARPSSPKSASTCCGPPRSPINFIWRTTALEKTGRLVWGRKLREACNR